MIPQSEGAYRARTPHRQPAPSALGTLLVNVADLVALGLLGISLSLALTLWVGVRRLRNESIRRAPEYLPPVSILKPLKGSDPGLEANLRTFFTHDYPAFELLFGVADLDDPAVPIVRGLMREYPKVPARLIVNCRRIGINPKVNNLANIADHASHEILLISDSNVRTSHSYVADMVARLEQGNTGLVSSAFMAVGESKLGGTLERLHVNTFLVGAMTASNLMFGVPMGVGKSQMIRRSDLDAIGGWEFLAQHLAEDQVMAQSFHAINRTVTQAGMPVENVIGGISVKQYMARQIRWASMRFRLTGPIYLLEIFFSTITMAAIACLLSPTHNTFIAAIAAIIIRALLDESADAVNTSRRRFWLKALWLSPLKDSLSAWVWIRGFTTNRIEWRGKVYSIGRHTVLSPRVQGEPRTIAPTTFQPTIVLSSDAFISGAIDAQGAIEATQAVDRALNTHIPRLPSNRPEHNSSPADYSLPESITLGATA